jgi:hypothetical protein
MKKIFFAVLAAFVLIGVYAPSVSAAICAAGDGAQVLWKGSWYPAHVKQVSGDGQKCFIHYDGYGSSWDEWVGSDRIQIKSTGGTPPPVMADPGFSTGASVSVLWKGTWYPASVIKVLGGGRYRIHYDGYDNSWDENVGPSRIRGR